MEKIPIKGVFSNEEIENKLSFKSAADRKKEKIAKPKYMLEPHPGFEIVVPPNGQEMKLAYNKLYEATTTDLDIELAHIAKLENSLYNQVKPTKVKKKLKFHYKKAITLISPKYYKGWHRWNENILDLFISEKTNKVLWGSGNCGKSATMALLLYTKWRVNPLGRMVIIASKVQVEASARVFAYIQEIHATAPSSHHCDFKSSNSKLDKGVYSLIYDEQENKYVKNERGCIVSLPVKVSGKTSEVGSNLLGRHPTERLIIAFDEAQELPARITKDKIFSNWKTNERLDIYAWGNPVPVDFYATEEHDLLFNLGAHFLPYTSLRRKQKMATKTTSWASTSYDTAVLHFAMTDSPKDDEDERHYMVEQDNGVERPRLYFLAGKENVAQIASDSPPNTPSYFSQVLGFPYINIDRSKNTGVINSQMVRESRKYPLIWKTPSHELQTFMGVDPASSGRYDGASIVVGKMGLMMDGRQGVDILNGEGCRQVKEKEGEDFVDTIIETMYGLSRYYKIPLRNIAIETHGVGEVIRYALQRHIEDGKWKDEYERGQSYHIINPTVSPTERYLFKVLGSLKKTKEMVTDISTEYWIAVRCLFLTRQIFNVPDYIVNQFYTRQLEESGSARKFKIEPKSNMRKRGVPSPNDADALVNVVELIRLRGFKYRYYNTGGYSPFYGDAYDRKMSAQKTRESLQVVGNLLNVGLNLGTHKESKKPPPIDTV